MKKILIAVCLVCLSACGGGATSSEPSAKLFAEKIGAALHTEAPLCLPVSIEDNAWPVPTKGNEFSIEILSEAGMIERSQEGEDLWVASAAGKKVETRRWFRYSRPPTEVLCFRWADYLVDEVLEFTVPAVSDGVTISKARFHWNLGPLAEWPPEEMLAQARETEEATGAAELRLTNEGWKVSRVDLFGNGDWWDVVP